MDKREYQARYYQEHKAEAHARYKRRYVPTGTPKGKPPKPRAVITASVNSYRRRVRLKVIDALGASCTCCGEREKAFLAIDHINNDGAAERKAFKGGTPFYRWVLRQGCPTDRYQILCYNCNMAKGLYGECPHRLEVRNLIAA